MMYNEEKQEGERARIQLHSLSYSLGEASGTTTFVYTDLNRGQVCT